MMCMRCGVSRGIATSTTAATKTYSTLNPSVTMYLFWSPRGTIGSERRDLYAQSRCNYVFILVTERDYWFRAS